MRTEPRRRRSESREPRALLLVPLALLRARLDRLLDFGAELDKRDELDRAIHESKNGPQKEEPDYGPPRPDADLLRPNVTNAELLRA